MIFTQVIFKSKINIDYTHVYNILNNLLQASVAEAVVHQSKLYSDEKNDIYHEWFSTLRIRYIRQLRNVENKLKSKIVRQALVCIYQLYIFLKS